MNQADTPALLARHQNHGFIAILSGHIGFVDLHAALQPFSVLPNHREANAMRPGPGGLVGAETQNMLQI